MFIEMIDYETGSKILINRDRIIKVGHGFNYVKLYFGKDEYFKVKHKLYEVKKMLNEKG